MNDKRRKLLKRSMKRTKGRVLSVLRDQHLQWMDLQIKRAIPDPEERIKYIDAMIDALVITCDNCDYRLACRKDYQNCQFNPVNEE